MKTKINQDNYNKVAKDVLRQIPTEPYKVSIFQGSRFARDIKTILSKYATSSTFPNIIYNNLMDVPLRKPVYGEFLIHAQTFHELEPLGTFLFLFKNEEDCSNIDTIFTPISFYKLSRMNAEVAPDVHRVAHVWYGTNNGFDELMPELGRLVIEGKFHKYLTPVGPLIKNINSTFLTKISSVVRGEVLSKSSPPENIKVLFPSDMFIDLDDTCPAEAIWEPVHTKAVIYVCIIYAIQENQPILGMCFFKSGKGMYEVLSRIKTFYADVVVNKINSLQQQFYINRLTFGAICRVGYTSSQIPIKQSTLHLKGNSIRVSEISDFTVNTGTWQVFL